MSDHIAYRPGYKYQLADTYVVLTGIPLEKPVQVPFLNLNKDGLLTIKAGYAWDGASGPAIDTANFMRGSLVHDALYQLMRQGLLATAWRPHADRLLKQICIEDGMWRLRAAWVYRGVRLGGGPSADPVSEKPILKAP